MNLTLQVVVPAAITSAVVTGMFHLISGYFERRHQEKLRLFELAHSIAKDRTEFGYRVAREEGKRIVLRDNVFLAEKYYHWLEHFFQTGSLPAEAFQTEERSKR